MIATVSDDGPKFHEMHPEEWAFHLHLDENPDDMTAVLVFADWLQDRDDPRADGYRAIGQQGLVCFKDTGRPGGYGSGEPDVHVRFEWWNRFDEDENPNFDHRCVLPWYDLLEGGWVYEDSGGTKSRDYLSRHDAMNAAALAFSRRPAHASA